MARNTRAVMSQNETRGYPKNKLESTVACLGGFARDTATTEIYTLSLHDALPIYFLILVFLAMRMQKLFRYPLMFRRNPNRFRSYLYPNFDCMSFALFKARPSEPVVVQVFISSERASLTMSFNNSYFDLFKFCHKYKAWLPVLISNYK